MPNKKSVQPRHPLFATLIGLLFLSSHAISADFSGKGENISKILEEAQEEYGYPGISLAISLDGEIYTDQIGYADIGGEGAPNSDTLFRIYSLSKGLTEILAEILSAEGVIDLNAPIERYLPDLPARLHGISSEQLLSHRAGIRHYESVEEWLSISQDHCSSPIDAFAQFIDDPLISEIGEEKNYSSYGYVLLSGVFEAASNKAFEGLMSEYILQPSQTQRIEFDNPNDREFVHYAKFYEPSGGVFLEAQDIDNSCKFGGGGINSTPTELVNIYDAYFSGKLTNGNFLEFRNTLRDQMSYGGEGLGGRSALFALPQEDLIIALFANARGGDLLPYAREISDLFVTSELE